MRGVGKCFGWSKIAFLHNGGDVCIFVSGVSFVLWIWVGAVRVCIIAALRVGKFVLDVFLER